MGGEGGRRGIKRGGVRGRMRETKAWGVRGKEEE